jgi:hypothetical protein
MIMNAHRGCASHETNAAGVVTVPGYFMIAGSFGVYVVVYARDHGIGG